MACLSSLVDVFSKSDQQRRRRGYTVASRRAKRTPKAILFFSLSLSLSIVFIYTHDIIIFILNFFSLALPFFLFCFHVFIRKMFPLYAFGIAPYDLATINSVIIPWTWFDVSMKHSDESATWLKPIVRSGGSNVSIYLVGRAIGVYRESRLRIWVRMVKYLVTTPCPAPRPR